MNSVYESLRALLRHKELEIKKLEKEIEALRIVLPIVAEAGLAPADAEQPAGASKSATDPNRTVTTMPSPKNFAQSPTTPDFDSLIAQATAASAGGTPTPNIPPPDLTPKPRTNWP